MLIHGEAVDMTDIGAARDAAYVTELWVAE